MRSLILLLLQRDDEHSDVFPYAKVTDIEKQPESQEQQPRKCGSDAGKQQQPRWWGFLTLYPGSFFRSRSSCAASAAPPKDNETNNVSEVIPKSVIVELE